MQEVSQTGDGLNESLAMFRYLIHLDGCSDDLLKDAISFGVLMIFIAPKSPVCPESRLLSPPICHLSVYLELSLSRGH